MPVFFRQCAYIICTCRGAPMGGVMAYDAKGSKAKRIFSLPFNGLPEHGSKIPYSYTAKKVTCVCESIIHRVRTKRVNVKALRKETRTTQILSSHSKFLTCFQRYAFDDDIAGSFVAWLLQVHACESIRQDVNSIWVVISFCYINGCFAWNIRLFDQKWKSKDKKRKLNIKSQPIFR